MAAGGQVRVARAYRACVRACARARICVWMWVWVGGWVTVGGWIGPGCGERGGGGAGMRSARARTVDFFVHFFVRFLDNWGLKVGFLRNVRAHNGTGQLSGPGDCVFLLLILRSECRRPPAAVGIFRSVGRQGDDIFPPFLFARLVVPAARRFLCL